MTEKNIYQQLSVAIVTFVAFAINFFLGIGIMMKGWGITEPRSWAWIIGGGIAVTIVTWGLTSSMKLIYGVRKNA